MKWQFDSKVALLSILSLAALAAPALADPYHGWHGNRGYWHGDGGAWRGGYWNHGWHGGRRGWWWVVGGLWTFYPTPIYPYPGPPVVVVQQTQPPVVVEPNSPGVASVPGGGQSWYYCRASKRYYPYAASCPGGWEPVSPTPPGVPR